MAITIEVWEDSGPVISGHGTIRQEVDNLGFKESGLDESFVFVDYPVGRPISPETFTLSFKKYYYIKFYGTYSEIIDYALTFVGSPEGTGSGTADNLHIIYNMTNVYAEPDNTLLVGTDYDPNNPPVIVPNLSTVGPENATGPITPVANTTYYTAYLVTQLYLDLSVDTDYGNLQDTFKLKFYLNEKKSGLPGYDLDLINWNP